MDLNWTLEELLQNVKLRFGIEKESKWRLRRLAENEEFYQEEQKLSLNQLGFGEGGTRIRIEKGEAPSQGNFNVRVKVRSKDEFDGKIVQVQCSFDKTFSFLKEKAREMLGFKPDAQLRLFLTDWTEEPVNSITSEQEKRMLRALNIKSGSTVVLSDSEFTIDKDYFFIQVYLTLTGFPSEFQPLSILKIIRTATLKEFKAQVSQTPIFRDHFPDFKEATETPRMRLREMKKNFSFGDILKGEETQLLKSFNLTNATQIVAQVMDKPELIPNDDILLYLRVRNPAKKIYGDYTEFSFHGKGEPTIEDLKDAICQEMKEKLGVNSKEEFLLVKYYSYEFKWKSLEAFGAKEEKKEASEHKDQPSESKEPSGKGKKGKKTQKKIETNLKKPPYLLRDGDVVGVALAKDDPEKKDDFQTEEDEKVTITKSKINKFQ